MTLTRTHLILLATAGSAAMLLAALAFQYLGGLQPCVLCIWQRWPHLAAVGIGVAAIFLRRPALPILGALAALTTAGIGVYHLGVELDWWAGLAQCAVNTLEGVSAADLLNTDVTVGAPAACDKVAWSLLGLSMPGWNALVSAGLAGIWLAAARES